MNASASYKGPFNVAVVQMCPRFGDIEHNLDKILTLAQSAVACNAKLIVFPEACTTGYMFSSVEEISKYAEGVPDGNTCQALIHFCRKNDVFIVAGIIENANNTIFNSSVLIGPSGYIGSYRKVHLWSPEKHLFAPGNLGFPVYETKIGRIGMHICYDSWFPESYRLCAVQGADIICVPADWVPVPTQRTDYPKMANMMTITGAHSNLVYVAAASRTGMERGQSFIGSSIIVDYSGWPIAGPSSVNEEKILYAEVDLIGSRPERENNEFNNPLADRRQDVYSKNLGVMV